MRFPVMFGAKDLANAVFTKHSFCRLNHHTISEDQDYILNVSKQFDSGRNRCACCKVASAGR